MIYIYSIVGKNCREGGAGAGQLGGARQNKSRYIPITSLEVNVKLVHPANVGE